MGNKNSRDGVAMIMVLVMIVIFAALILAVVISSSAAIRRAHYYKDKAVALQIAQAGLEEVLNQMNYTAYDNGYYPFGWSDPSFAASSSGGETTIDVGVGKATIMINPDGITGADTQILAIGKYRGREAKISCEIRSDSEISRGDKLNDVTTLETQGIPEAFNKHTIYAHSVPITNTTIKGNITTTSARPNPWPSGWTEATWVETSSVSIPILSSSYKPEDPKNLIPAAPTTIWDQTFKDTDNDGYVDVPGGTYSVNSGAETYTIDAATIGNEKWIFERANSASSLKVIIKGNTSMTSNGVVKSGASGDTNASLEVDFSASDNPNIQGHLVAEGGITIKNTGNTSPNPIGTVGSVTLWAGVNLTVNNTSTMPQINGDIIGISKVEFTGSSQVNLNGSINSKGTITIPVNLTINIDARNGQRKGAIVLYNESNATLTLTTQSSSTINITIGDNQVGGILIYFDGITTIGGTGKKTDIALQGTITFTSPSNRFFLINHSEEVASNFNINPSNPVASPLTGSFYSAFYRDTNQTINFNGNVKGGIITNGTVNLNGGSLTYDPAPYQNSTGSVYKGFVGGRRRYVPVPGSWRIIW